MEDPKAIFNTKNELKYSNETGANYEVKKAIIAAGVRHYIEREVRLVSNMNNIYGII